MDIAYIVTAVLVSAGITLFWRAFPFLIFRGERKMPLVIMKLGQVLPSTIMAVLIIYCLKDAFLHVQTEMLPNAVAVLAVAVSYKWKHNTFLSILLGTAVYMVLLRIL